MKFFEVLVFDGEKEVFHDIVKSKEPRTAISNVLVNKYKGNVSKVTAQEVNVIIPKVVKQG
jgi:hypothetical protein